MRIIGPASASYETVQETLRLRMVTELRFVDEMLPALWNAALRYGIDPVGMVAQSYKETGGGTFQGQVKPRFYNTAGIKVRHQDLFPALSGDLPLAHAMFPSWHIGARAHAQHLIAYAGGTVPETEVVDPRYLLVKVTPATWCENFEDLAGRWAPSPAYGTELVAIARRLQGRA